MEFKTQILIASVNEKKFTGKNGDEISYRELTGVTDEGDTFTFTIAKDVDISAEDKGKTAQVTIKISKNERGQPKMKIIEA